VYRYVASSVAGFIQKLAVSCTRHGYWFYVMGEIPAHKDLAKTDRKIIAQYEIAVSKWARARRKQAGLANLHYLRFERFYVIVAIRLYRRPAKVFEANVSGENSSNESVN
jgi:hypothetical protein